jgi:hypothetical protein
MSIVTHRKVTQPDVRLVQFATLRFDSVRPMQMCALLEPFFAHLCFSRCKVLVLHRGEGTLIMLHTVPFSLELSSMMPRHLFFSGSHSRLQEVGVGNITTPNCKCIIFGFEAYGLLDCTAV